MRILSIPHSWFLIVRDDMPMQACILAQAAIADWKNRSIYKSDEWRVVGYKCVPGGDYMPKDMT